MSSPDRVSAMHDATAVKTNEAAAGAAAMQGRSVAADPKSWMGLLPDETPAPGETPAPIQTLLCDINLPGTHDSGSINTSAWTSTPYACQDKTITEELGGGIRVLDIRLKAKANVAGYEIVLCHGYWGFGLDLNEYETFPSALKQCNDFLAANPREAIVMILKFDDGWPDVKDSDTEEVQTKNRENRVQILNDLESNLNVYPNLYLKSKDDKAKKNIRGQKDMPTLKEARGKIVLFQRIDGNLRFGAPISWLENTSGYYGKDYDNRSYKVYVQDHWTGVWSRTKENEVWAAAILKGEKKEVFLNFVNATQAFQIMGLYVNGGILGKFGTLTASDRPSKVGWMLFDYAFTKYPTFTSGKTRYVNLVDFIIASNFGYQGYEAKFEMDRGL